MKGVSILKKKQSVIIDALCNRITSNEFPYSNELVGILLTGSFAQGKSHPNSDIDIHVIIASNISFVKHICQVYENRIVQIQIYSLLKFKNDCMKHDRKRPAIYACKLLYDVNGQCSEYLNHSKKYLDEGPERLTAQEKQILLTKIKTEIYTAEGLIAAGNELSALLLANEMVQLVINYYNDANHYWMTNNNYLFNEFKEHNEELGMLAEKIIFCVVPKLKISMLKDFCRKCIPDFDKINIEYCYEVQI